MMGLAAMGQLNAPGQNNKEKAQLGMGGTVNGQSFFGYNAGVNQELNKNFGPAAVAAQYNQAQTGYTGVSDQERANVPYIGTPLGNPGNNAQQRVREGQ
jgi:hypothetical protein